MASCCSQPSPALFECVFFFFGCHEMGSAVECPFRFCGLQQNFEFQPAKITLRVPEKTSCSVFFWPATSTERSQHAGHLQWILSGSGCGPLETTMTTAGRWGFMSCHVLSMLVAQNIQTYQPLKWPNMLRLKVLLESQFRLNLEVSFFVVPPAGPFSITQWQSQWAQWKTKWRRPLSGRFSHQIMMVFAFGNSCFWWMCRQVRGQGLVRACVPWQIFVSIENPN